MVAFGTFGMDVSFRSGFVVYTIEVFSIYTIAIGNIPAMSYEQ